MLVYAGGLAREPVRCVVTETEGVDLVVRPVETLSDIPMSTQDGGPAIMPDGGQTGSCADVANVLTVSRWCWSRSS